MKPRNFPARKLARQIAAELRAHGRPGITSDKLYAEDIGRGGALTTARNIRTKKRRAS